MTMQETNHENKRLKNDKKYFGGKMAVFWIWMLATDIFDSEEG